MRLPWVIMTILQPQHVLFRIAQAASHSSKTLDISQCGLTSIPESVRSLTNLRKLYLYENQLTALPEWIGELSNLKILHLEKNRLKSIPDSIASLSSLEVLEAGRNPRLDWHSF
jgi:internalin A